MRSKSALYLHRCGVFHPVVVALPGTGRLRRKRGRLWVWLRAGKRGKPLPYPAGQKSDKLAGQSCWHS